MFARCMSFLETDRRKKHTPDETTDSGRDRSSHKSLTHGTDKNTEEKHIIFYEGDASYTGECVECLNEDLNVEIMNERL